MRYAVDPRQKALFDPAETMFSPMAVRHMRQDWPGVFRHQILHLMPVGKLGERFHPTLGCPTKELYSMAGAIFLKEFFNLTIEEAVHRYLTSGEWHYALNVVPTAASLSHASIERYMKIFAEDDLAREIFHRVASALIEALELDVSRQRLDSTHIFSDMATFGRSKLMRTRGRPRVRMAVMLRCAGWNILRALTTWKKRGIRDFAAFAEAFLRRLAGLRSFGSATRRRYPAKIVSNAFPPKFPPRRPADRHLTAA